MCVYRFSIITDLLKCHEHNFPVEAVITIIDQEADMYSIQYYCIPGKYFRILNSLG